MATYTISMTARAFKNSLDKDISSMLIAAHRRFDPSVPLASIKTLRSVYGSTRYPGGSCYLDGSTPHGQDEPRYVRIVIDLIGDEKAMPADRKEKLMQMAMETVMDYEGKKAEGTEIEVLVHVVDPANVMRISASPAGRR